MEVLADEAKLVGKSGQAVTDNEENMRKARGGRISSSWHSGLGIHVSNTSGNTDPKAGKRWLSFGLGARDPDQVDPSRRQSQSLRHQLREGVVYRSRQAPR